MILIGLVQIIISLTYGRQLLNEIESSIFELQLNNSNLLNQELHHQNLEISCLEIDNFNPDKCFKCKQGYFLNNKIDRQCIKCQDGCNNCSTKENCFDFEMKNTISKQNDTQIGSYFKMIKQRWLLSCNSDEYILNGACKKCNSACKSCIITDTQCTDCPVNKYLNNFSCLDSCPQTKLSQGNICKDTCDDGYYADLSTKTCIKCSDGCQTCYNQYQCYDICQKGYYLLDGQCITTCPGGYYPSSGSFLQCQRCKQYCTQCTSDTTCSKCQQGYYLDPVTQNCLACPYNCKECTNSDPLSCTSCLSVLSICLKQNECQLPTGYYYDSNCVKKKCPDNCKRCNSGGCLECSDKYFLIYSSSGYTCQNCHETCSNCTGLQKNECTSCSSPLVFYRYQCLSECPLGYFSNSEKKCEKCPSSTLFCATCSNLNECTSCLNGYFLFDDQVNNKRVCNKCHPNCRICTGPLSSNCSPCSDGSSTCNNCAEGYFQNGTTCFSLSNSQICSSNSYPNYDAKSCQLCPTNCLTCNQQVCKSCINNNYYLTINGECKKCSEASNIMKNCLSCKDQYTCQVCQANYRLNASTGECLPYCPPIDGYYQKVDSTCDKCPLGCTKCSLVSSALVQCTDCSDGYFLDQSTKQCSACNPNCLICQSTSSCIKCNKDSYLMPATNSQPSYCVSTCNPGYYREVNSRLCVKCSIQNCDECASPYECTKCSTSYYLDSLDKKCYECSNSCIQCKDKSICTLCLTDFILSQNGDGSVTCLRSCGSNQYVSSSPLSCKDCQKQKCEFCFSDNRCLSCTNNYYLKINLEDPNNSSCEKCSSECLTCDGPTAKECFTCAVGYYYFQKQCLSQSQCLAMVGYYADSTTYFCSKCYPLCTSCSSGVFNKCNSCIDGYFLSPNFDCQVCDTTCKTCTQTKTKCTSCKNNFFLQKSTNTCISSSSSCQDGFYNDKLTNECQPCVSPCLKCTGSSIYECTKCIDGYYDDLNGVVKCVKCDSNCQLCHSEKNEETNLYEQICDTCLNGYYKSDPSQKTCKQCNKSQYSINNQCKDCHTSCTSCLSDQETSCTQCPEKQYVSKVNPSDNSGKCQNCFKGCLTCTSSEQNKCSTCVSGYYFYNNQCYLQCPYNLVPDTNSVCQCKIDGCSQCVVDEQQQKAVCVKCSNSQQFLYNYSCVDTCPDPLFKNLISKLCVSNCQLTEYQNRTLKECTSECHLFSMVDPITSQNICTNTCPTEYFTDSINRVCTLCDKKCLTCSGPTNYQCLVCSNNNFMHEGTSFCNDICIDGYVLNQQKSMCVVCQNDCSTCKQDLVLYINQCLQKCPFGFKKQENTNRCVVQYEQSVEILNEDTLQKEGASPFKDLKLEGILINIDPSRVVSVEWKLQSSTDQSIQQLFTGNNSQIFKYNLILYVSQNYLRGDQKHIFELEVRLPKNVVFVRKAIVYIKKEMIGGKFNINQGYKDELNPFNSFYSFSMGFFETSRSQLTYRIQCEKLKVIDDIYLVTTQNFLAFDEVTYNMLEKDSSQSNVVSDDNFQTSTDKYYFPVSNTDQNYICSLIIRGKSSNSDTLQQKQQEDLAILYQNITIPAFNHSIQQLEFYIYELMFSHEKSPSQWSQLAYSLDYIIYQFSPEIIAQKLMQESLKIDLSNAQQPPTQQTVNSIWKSLFDKCDLSINEFSTYCQCQNGFVGIFCSYDSSINQMNLLTTLQNVLLTHINTELQAEITKSSSIPLMDYIQLIRQILRLKLAIDQPSQFYSNIIQYIDVILLKRDFSTIGDFAQDIFIIMEELEIYIQLSIYTDNSKQSLLAQLNSSKNKWDIYLSKNTNLGESQTFYGIFSKSNLVTVQQTRTNDKRMSEQTKIQSYLSISFDEINIDIPPQVVFDWDSLTIIQRTKTFLPQAETNSNSILLSPIYDIDLYSQQSEEKLKYDDLTQPFYISLRLQTPLVFSTNSPLSIQSFECVYFDESKGKWLTDGLKTTTIKNSDTIVCQTTHLSRFAIRKAPNTPAYTQSDIIDTAALSLRLPPKSTDITSFDEQKPGSKSMPLQDWIKNSMIQSLKLRNSSRNPYYIDSFIDVQSKTINVINHLRFPGIIPFTYPERFLSPFGLYFVLVWILWLIFTILLVKFQVAQVISNIIQYIIKRKQQKEIEKQEKKSKEEKKQSKIKKLKQKEERQKKLEQENDQTKKEQQLPEDQIESEQQKDQIDEEKKDIILLQKLKKDMKLLYQSGNLDTPKSQYDKQSEDNNMFDYVDNYKNKKTTKKNDEQGFGSFAEKRMRQQNKVEDYSSNSIFKNALINKVQRSDSRKGSTISMQSYNAKSNRNRRNENRQGSVIPKGPAVQIWKEEDFFIKLDMFTMKKQDIPKMKKDILLKRKSKQDDQLLLIKNPLKHYQWYHHHPVLSILLKSTQTNSAKLINLAIFNLSLLGQGACSTISNNLSELEAYLLTVFAAPLLVYLLFSLYTLLFFTTSQSDKFAQLRGTSTHFAITFHTRYIFGLIVISVLTFVGFCIILIEFGQKQYIDNSEPVILRFVFSALLDIFGVEVLLLCISFIVFKLQKNISPLSYFLYFVLKGYAINFAEITNYYLQKSEKEQKEQRKLQDITFKGDIQNKRREKISKKLTVKSKSIKSDQKEKELVKIDIQSINKQS